MQFQFKIIPAQSIAIVVPLVKKMSKPLITEALLLERFKGNGYSELRMYWRL